MIICPRCGMTSHNPNDEKEKYCGSCHMFHDQMIKCSHCDWRAINENELNIHIRLRHRVVNDR